MTWESDAWIKEHMATNAELIEAIDQAIAGNTDGIQSVEIRGRKIVHMPITDLIKARAMLQVQNARAERGLFFVGRPRR